LYDDYGDSYSTAGFFNDGFDFGNDYSSYGGMGSFGSNGFGLDEQYWSNALLSAQDAYNQRYSEDDAYSTAYASSMPSFSNAIDYGAYITEYAHTYGTGY
jgi:hypothetical protein